MDLEGPGVFSCSLCALYLHRDFSRGQRWCPSLKGLGGWNSVLVRESQRDNRGSHTSPFRLQLSEKFHMPLSCWAPVFGGALILRESAVLVLHLQPWRIGRGEVFLEKFSSCA